MIDRQHKLGGPDRTLSRFTPSPDLSEKLAAAAQAAVAPVSIICLFSGTANEKPMHARFTVPTFSGVHGKEFAPMIKACIDKQVADIYAQLTPF